MNIRDARREDLEVILDLAGRSRSAARWPASFYSDILDARDVDRISLVAEYEGAILGFLIARSAGDECELETIVVAEERRGRGVGLKLIRSLMRAARDCHAGRIFLEVRESNVSARSFYEACGFSSGGRRKGYYRDPAEDAVLYAMML